MDLSKYTPVEVAATYDSRTFSSVGYTLVNKKWHKKKSLKAKVDAPKATRASADSVSLLLKEAEDIKTQIVALESNM